VCGGVSERRDISYQGMIKSVLGFNDMYNKKGLLEKQANARFGAEHAAETVAAVHTAGKKGKMTAGLFRLFASWFAFSGLYAMFAVCPFCGQSGCPVGAGSAGIVGAFMALCTQKWKTLLSLFRKKDKKSKLQPDTQNNKVRSKKCQPHTKPEK
jgi:hypothetical protein